MRGKTRSKHARASKPLFYSAMPRIVFREMLPDEEAVRTVNEWHRTYAAQADSFLALDSVTLFPLAKRQHRAQLRLAGGTAPIEAAGESPSLAVQRALDRLQAEARFAPLPRARGGELTLVA